MRATKKMNRNHTILIMAMALAINGCTPSKISRHRPRPAEAADARHLAATSIPTGPTPFQTGPISMSMDRPLVPATRLTFPASLHSQLTGPQCKLTNLWQPDGCGQLWLYEGSRTVSVANVGDAPSALTVHFLDPATGNELQQAPFSLDPGTMVSFRLGGSRYDFELANLDPIGNHPFYGGIENFSFGHVDVVVEGSRPIIGVVTADNEVQPTPDLQGSDQTMLMTIPALENLPTDSQTLSLCRPLFDGTDLSFGRFLTSSGGTVQITFQATAECDWTAALSGAGFRLLGAGSGKGAGTIGIAVDSNPGSNDRVASLTVLGATITILQEGTAAQSGNPAPVANPDCKVTAVNGDPTLHIIVLDRTGHPFAPVTLSTSPVGCVLPIKNVPTGSGLTVTQNADSTLTITAPANPSTTRYFTAFQVADRWLGILQREASGSLRLYPDVNESILYYVLRVVQSGVWPGCGNGNYCPGTLVTRAQMATMIMGAPGQASRPVPPGNAPYFDDVLPGMSGYDAVQKMMYCRITSGTVAPTANSRGYYGGERNITRGEMAVFLTRVRHGAGACGVDLANPGPNPNDGFDYPKGVYFPEDVPETHGFFKWVQAFRADGITSGCSATKFCVGDNVTHGQMAVFTARALLGAP